MSIENLDKIFQPNSIAVIGASARKGSVGHALMHNLIERGFSGQIFPINPNHKKIGKLPACPSIRDLEVPVDLAIISTPITLVPQIVQDCVDVGVGGAVIISAGGKEIGEPGKKLEEAIQKEAGHSGIRIIGPNCVGIMSSRSKLNASFASQMPIAGKMAFISQSGAICTAILDLSIQENIGFSYFVSLGDMLDVDFGDMIDYLGGETDVGSIVMYVESLTNFRKFMSAARAVSRVKPIIVLKAGRTQAGALAAASHTGAMAGEDSVYDAAFQRAGILRVKTFEELFDCAELLITSWVGGIDMQKGRDIFNQAGIPTFDTPERAVRAFMDIFRFSKNIEMLQQIPSRLPGRPKFDRETAKNLIQEGLGAQNYLLTEIEAKALLSSYGIPVKGS
jgi:acetyltransferase